MYPDSIRDVLSEYGLTFPYTFIAQHSTLSKNSTLPLSCCPNIQYPTNSILLALPRTSNITNTIQKFTQRTNIDIYTK